MNPLAKAGVAFGALAGGGGTAYGIYNSMQPAPEKVKTYSEELEGALLTATDDSQQENWKSRLASLQAVAVTELVEGIKELKTQKEGDQWKELRKWCQDTIKQPSKGKDNKEFQNIQNYCTYSIKEKITGAIDESKDANAKEWKDGYDALIAITNDNELDETLKGYKTKPDDGQKKAAIKTWCTAAYKKPYKGPNDKDFKNASRICKPKA